MARCSIEAQIEADLATIKTKGHGTIYGDHAVNRLILRKYDFQEDGQGIEGKPNVATPLYVLVTNDGRGKSLSYSGLEAIQGLAQDVQNTHRSRILLVCSHKNVEESVFYAADSIVSHHNDLMDKVDPVLNGNPFSRGRTIETAIFLSLAGQE